MRGEDSGCPRGGAPTTGFCRLKSSLLVSLAPDAEGKYDGLACGVASSKVMGGQGQVEGCGGKVRRVGLHCATTCATRAHVDHCPGRHRKRRVMQRCGDWCESAQLRPAGPSRKPPTAMAVGGRLHSRACWCPGGTCPWCAPWCCWRPPRAHAPPPWPAPGTPYTHAPERAAHVTGQPTQRSLPAPHWTCACARAHVASTERGRRPRPASAGVERRACRALTTE